MAGERYIFYGRLVTQTGLHVGSGYGDVRTDATVVKEPDERPFIPGSSLKGALRSRVEGLVAALPAELGLRSCRLDSSAGVACATVDKAWQKEYAQKLERGASESDLEDYLLGQGLGGVTLCDTCRLFGSPYLASPLLVRDAPLDGAVPDLAVRHGVGIDRETGTAREQIKFDYEVVPSQTAFRFELSLEPRRAEDVGLLAVGLREMQLGAVPLGGNTSRGLGDCRLELERIVRLNWADAGALLHYLTGSEPDRIQGTQEWVGAEATAWLKARIEDLLQRSGTEG